MKFEVSPQLPTSGQILGFSGQESWDSTTTGCGPRTAQKVLLRTHATNIVKDSSRSEIIEAISEALAELGFQD